MSEPIKASQGSIFLQLSPDAEPEYIGACSDLGDLPAPVGDQTPIYCRDANGQSKIVGTSKGAAALGTSNITSLLFPESDVIDRLKNCNFTLYAMLRDCGKAGIFSNYVRGRIAHHARLTNRNWQNLVKREGDDAALQVLDFAYWGIYEIRNVTAVRQTIAETRSLNDIVFDMNSICAGDCGPTVEPDDNGFIGSDGSAGSPTSDADVWLTTDKGSNWANATGAVPSPFSGGDIISMVRFQTGKDTWRLLVASGPKAGNAQVAYSDDDGSTWTTVTVGSTAWEGASAADALFALDHMHIWYATDHGRVYFSDDGGVTWTSQTSALTASLARALNSVHFFDSLNGFAVGNSDTIIHTVDGGSNWAALTAPTSGKNLKTVRALSADMLIIGGSGDSLYKSLDTGANWTTISFTGKGMTGTVQGVDFVPDNDLIGFMIQDTSAPLGSIHRTLDGGVTWEKITTPTNAGLNAVTAIDENTAFAVGEAQGGTGVVIRVHG